MEHELSPYHQVFALALIQTSEIVLRMGRQRNEQKYVLLFLSPQTQMSKGDNRMKHVVFYILLNLLIVVIKLLFIEIIHYLCNRLRRNLNRTFMELK